jgi:hypothetical protein
MARTQIFKRDGASTPYFWSSQDGTGEDRKRIYKKTQDGVKRMKGVYFNVTTNRLRKD